MANNEGSRAPKTVEAWAFVQQMLGDITRIMAEDAENDLELLEGLRVVSRVTALCSELTVEADPDLPWFFDMCSPTRLIGGPNPDGNDIQYAPWSPSPLDAGAVAGFLRSLHVQEPCD